MLITLSSRHKEKVLHILRQHLPDRKTKIYVFGSRARGTAKMKSDLDLAIDTGGERLDSSLLSRIKQDFEDSSLPFFIDLLDLNAVGLAFKARILPFLQDLEKETEG